MERREIIKKTLLNMSSIYSDIGKLAQVIEEKMTNNNFEPIGSSALTWETSNSMHYPDSWLYKWFARAYTKNQSRRITGFSIHLGDYSADDESKIPGDLPVMSVSALEPRNSVSGNDLRNLLWWSGWGDKDKLEKGEVLDQRLFVSRRKDKDKNGNIKESTYFIDLLTLKNKQLIENLVVRPMIEMFNNNETWVLENCAGQLLPII